jgi:choloylglycine hydrolase
MINKFFPVIVGSLILLISFIKVFCSNDTEARNQHSCSTFLLSLEGNLLVGHNLDDYIEVPGRVVVNKRGVKKENISWDDIGSFWGRSESSPRIRWISKYGSITYNTFGKEFIDGGMNEAGFYVGEMTCFGTQYPKNDSLPKFYHHQWMQYLLDNYATVEEAVGSLRNALIDGHCQWHFFIADRNGSSAVIEFMDVRSAVRQGDNLPIKALCNRCYSCELDSLKAYQGFGGKRIIDFNDSTDDKRFVWAAAMLEDSNSLKIGHAYQYAFSILRQLGIGNNKWSLVYDLKNLTMYFHTYRCRQIKSLNFSSFDFSCSTPALILDIHRDVAGNVADQFVPYSHAANTEFIKSVWSEIDFGFFGNTFFKPAIVKRLSSYAKDFSCTD